MANSNSLSTRMMLSVMLALSPVVTFAVDGAVEQDGTKVADAGTSASEAVMNTTATASTPAAASESKIIGQLDIRPSYLGSAADWHTENTLEGGYQFDKNTKLSYVNYFNTNIYHAVQGNVMNGGLDIQDGFLRFKRANIWSNSSGLSLNYQARAYLPTWAYRRDNGFVLGIRNYATLMQTVGDVDFIFAEAPTVYGYGRANANSGKANIAFTQMAILEADFHLSKSLTLSLPIIFQNDHYREAAGASNSGAWVHTLYAWPELDFEIADHQTIGFAFYTDNFVTGDLSGFTPGDAMKGATYQFIYNLAL